MQTCWFPTTARRSLGVLVIVLAALSPNAQGSQRYLCAELFTPPRAPLRLETERLVLRQWNMGDGPALEAINRDPRVMESYAFHWRATDMILSAHRSFRENRFGFWAVTLKSSNELIGLLGFQKIPLPAPAPQGMEIGWHFSPDHQGQGYAREAAQTAIADFRRRLGSQPLYALIHQHNGASQNLALRLGFTRRPDLDFDHPLYNENDPRRHHWAYEFVD